MLRRSAIALVMITVTAACPSETPNRDSGDTTTSSSKEAEKRSETVGEDFRWPNDATHPVMRLEIAAGEDHGTIEIELMPELAPKSVRRITELATNEYYDGTTFHRVIPGFMIQGGDPNSRDHDPSNDGRGGADTDLPDESSAAPFARGVVALANRGHQNSNSSQFFIMQSDVPGLTGQYTVVGRVTSGIDLVDRIATTATDKVGRWGPKDRPLDNILIRRMTIENAPADPQGIRPHLEDPPEGVHSSGDAGSNMTKRGVPSAREPSWEAPGTGTRSRGPKSSHPARSKPEARMHIHQAPIST